MATELYHGLSLSTLMFFDGYMTTLHFQRSEALLGFLNLSLHFAIYFVTFPYERADVFQLKNRLTNPLIYVWLQLEFSPRKQNLPLK
jgi:hypothetical protein